MENLSPPAPSEKLEDVLVNLAKTDASRFRMLCRRMRETSPEQLDRACEQVARVCLREMAAQDGNSAGHPMLSWLIADGRYLGILLDSDFLSPEEAQHVAVVLRDADPGFFLNFERLSVEANAERDLRRLERALRLFNDLGNCSVLLPWLRTLTNHPDERIRSKAVKSFCEIRPNPALVERQLKASDPRVRANAIEALWGVQSLEAAAIFREALSDPSHRVVVNALVGLYAHNKEEALEKLLSLCKHAGPMFRAAAAWGLGRITDKRAIPALEALKEDPSAIVRARVARVLASLRAEGEN